MSATPRARVPAYIVTGFLGAGKTTLLRRLIENAGERRFAVIVNEFGEMGFDGELIEACCQDVVELKNGCVCCRVGDDLVPTLEAVLERETPPDAILIETSGPALPQPVVEAFRFPTLARRTTVAGVVVVADAPVIATGTFDAVLAGLKQPPTLEPKRPNALHGGTDGDDDPIAEVFEDQLRAADLVVLSKVDALATQSVERLDAELRASLPAGVVLARSNRGRIDARTILDLAAAAQDHLEARPSRHALEGPNHAHDDFEGIVLEAGPVADRAAFERRVAAAAATFGLLRVKGFLSLEGRDRRFLVQSTPTSTVTSADRAWTAEDDRGTRLVVIGPKGLRVAEIQRAIFGEIA